MCWSFAPAPGALPFSLPTPFRRLSQIKLSDTQQALVLSAVLFFVGAWPLALTEIPLYQDLPNHLATLTVIENLKIYPEYVFNCFFNSFKNRQSVPYAMSFCGLDWIIPTSCRGRAWKRTVSSGSDWRQRS